MHGLFKHVHEGISNLISQVLQRPLFESYLKGALQDVFLLAANLRFFDE